MKVEKFQEPVRDMSIGAENKLSDIVRQYKASGWFVAKNIGIAADIVAEMTKKAELRFLSFPACIIATGLRGLICELVKRKLFDVVITTCGTLDHDIARSFADYYHGSFDLDDRQLEKAGINRLGNIVFPAKNYGVVVEEKVQPVLEELYKNNVKELSTYELCWELGKRMGPKSILYWAQKNEIPMVIPGPTDGAVGFQVHMFAQDHDFKLNVLKDEKLLQEKVLSAKTSGAVIIGGGISKHHTIWWNQFKGGLDWAVYVTTAVEWDGSLSGARPREAISWGKISENAKMVTVEGDATVVLPLIMGPIL